jgi:hypothetical protein
MIESLEFSSGLTAISITVLISARYIHQSELVPETRKTSSHKISETLTRTIKVNSQEISTALTKKKFHSFSLKKWLN